MTVLSAGPSLKENGMDMIERVARAIALEALDPETRAAVDPEKWFVAESYYDLARAAIEALRKPTEAMVEVGTEARWKSAVRDANSVREIWAHMIDAALKEHERVK